MAAMMEKLNLKLFNSNSRNETSKQRCLVNRLRCASRYTQQDAGFSLLELLVVMVMIGILAAIAAPSWLGFVNRQRLNKANDAVFAALQEAQRQAKKTKLSYSVSFTTNSTNVVKVAVYPSSSSGIALNDNRWQSLGGDLQITAGTVLLSTNIASPNTIGTTISSTAYVSTTQQNTITFDYMGTLPNPNFGTPPTGSTDAPGLKIVLASAISSVSSSSSVKRCVIVKTLLGSMLTAKDDKCT